MTTYMKNEQEKFESDWKYYWAPRISNDEILNGNIFSDIFGKEAFLAAREIIQIIPDLKTLSEKRLEGTQVYYINPQCNDSWLDLKVKSQLYILIGFGVINIWVFLALTLHCLCKYPMDERMMNWNALQTSVNPANASLATAIPSNDTSKSLFVFRS